jgi:hypothetical protein
MAEVSELDAMKIAFDALSKLEPERRSRAARWLVEALGVEVAAPELSDPSLGDYADREPTGGPSGAPAGRQTPKAFLAAKKPKTAVERVACLAYYLTHDRETSTFKTKEVVALNTEAALPKLANAVRDVNNAADASGFLASAGRGDKQITSRGEALVEALPDREAVKKALEDHPYKRRTRRSSARSSSARRTTTGKSARG